MKILLYLLTAILVSFSVYADETTPCENDTVCGECWACDYNTNLCVEAPSTTPCTNDGHYCTADYCYQGECTHYVPVLGPYPKPCPDADPCQVCDGVNVDCVAGNEGAYCWPVIPSLQSLDARCVNAVCSSGVCGSAVARNLDSCDSQCHACYFGTCDTTRHDNCEPGSTQDGQTCYISSSQVLQSWGWQEPTFMASKCTFSSEPPSEIPEFGTYGVMIAIISVVLLTVFMRRKLK